MSPGLKDWEMHYNLEILEHRLQAVKLVTHLQVHLARSVAEVIAHYNDDILDHIQSYYIIITLISMHCLHYESAIESPTQHLVPNMCIPDSLK